MPKSLVTVTRKDQKLFPKDWLVIVNLAKNGVSVKEIAKQFAVSEATVYRGLKLRHVDPREIAAQAAQELANKDKQKIIERIRETKDNDYRLTEFLQKQVVTTIVNAQKEGKRVGSVIDDVKTIKIAIDALRAGTENKFRVLGLDKENENADAVLPELPIRDLTGEEIAAMRNRQNIEDGITLDDADLAEIEDALNTEEVEDAEITTEEIGAS